MGAIDFTTWTETDSDNRLTVTADRVQWALLENRDVGRAHYDFGAGYFDGDINAAFTLLLSVLEYIPANTAYFGALCFTSAIDSLLALRSPGVDAINLWGADGDSLDPFGLSIEENNNGALTGDNGNLNRSTPYYCTFVRDEAVGAFGTAYLYLYTDTGKTVLHDTLVITLTKKMDLRYGVVANTWENGTTSYTSGYVEDLDIAGINDHTAFMGGGFGDSSSFMGEHPDS